MFLGRVKGQVVSTVKDATLKGAKLLLVEPLKVQYDDPAKAGNGTSGSGRFDVTGRAIVAIDKLGVGVDQVVLVTQGSSARLAEGCNKMPTDAVIIGVVDEASVHGSTIYQAQTPARSK
jgi:ethanolamine utilization protein EutN